MKLFKFQQEGLGIDLGTSNSIISDENGKIIINEPSVVAIDTVSYTHLTLPTKA